MDGSDPRHILRNNAQGWAFALVGNRALEDDNPVGDEHVDSRSRSPRLLIDFSEDLFANFRVGPSADRLLGEQADQGGHHVGPAHDASEASLIDHRQPLHTLVFH